MTVRANGAYAFPAIDARANFHGAMLLYAGWDRHRMFASPYAWPLPPDLPFGAFVAGPMAGVFGQHPDWARIDWAGARWTRNGKPFAPDFAKGIEANGLTHKDSLRFETPGLDGIDGSGL